MPNVILVTYATRAGSTAGVAEAIGETLSDCGAPVVVHPMLEVSDLLPYRAVVAGSAIHDKRWLPEAMQWVETQRAALAQKPFAAFLVCMTLAMKHARWAQQVNVLDWLAPVRALAPTVSEAGFAGALDISKIPYFAARLRFRISVWTGVWKEGDHRDRAQIRAWARTLPAKLG